MILICRQCNTENQISNKLGFREECMKCGQDLHACNHCEFFDPKVYNECRETSADPVKEKDRANYCDYYEPGSSNDLDAKKEEVLSAAEALFKNLK